MRRLRSGMALCVMVVVTAGCHSYRSTTLPSPNAPNRALAPNVRVTTTSGAMYRLVDAQVVGDSVIGNAQASQLRMAIAVRDVQAVEEWRISAGKTALQAGGVAAVGVAVGVAAAFLLYLSAY